MVLDPSPGESMSCNHLQWYWPRVSSLRLPHPGGDWPWAFLLRLVGGEVSILGAGFNITLQNGGQLKKPGYLQPRVMSQ